jgi:hypothetical protein
MIPQPSSANRFPFNTSKPLDSLNNNAGAYDGLSGFSIDASSASAGKKKRGWPRKYSPDGNIALGLAPTPISASSAANHGEPASASAGSGPASMSEPTLKKHRGRPPGSGKKQLDALGKFYALEFERDGDGDGVERDGDGDGDGVEGEGWQRKNVGLQTSKGLGERRMTIDFLLFCFVFFFFFFLKT